MGQPAETLSGGGGSGRSLATQPYFRRDSRVWMASTHTGVSSKVYLIKVPEIGYVVFCKSTRPWIQRNGTLNSGSSRRRYLGNRFGTCAKKGLREKVPDCGFGLGAWCSAEYGAWCSVVYGSWSSTTSQKSGEASDSTPALRSDLCTVCTHRLCTPLHVPVTLHTCAHNVHYP